MTTEAVLAVLTRVAEGNEEFHSKLCNNPAEELKSYELNVRRAAVLASGDIGLLEKWFSKLDERLLTWPKSRQK
jgi:hypothetical protein